MTGKKSVEKENQPKSPAIVDDENSNSSNTNGDVLVDEDINGENELENGPPKKRKRSGDDNDDNNVSNDKSENEKKSRISSKLSVFALRRKSVSVDDDNDLPDV
jgi:hypothetical protein